MGRKAPDALPGLAATLALALSLCSCTAKPPVEVFSNLPVVAAGLTTTCTVDPTRQLVCFGAAVGDGAGTFTAHTSPYIPTGLGRVKAVTLSAASNTVCVIKADAGSTVTCWGYQGVGATFIGLPKVPVDVPGVQGAVAISAGGMRVCAALADGGVTCWRFDDQRDSAVDVAPLAGLSGITALSMGDGHACGIRTDQSVLCWGQNQHGELGTGVIAPTADPQPPTVVPGLKALSVSAGQWHSCAVITDGTVRCWGWNLEGEIGAPKQPIPESFATPQPVPGVADAKAVSAGSSFTCTVLANRTVQCWGRNAKGQLGNGTLTRSHIPTAVQGLQSAVFVSAGNEHACASGLGLLTKCWGRNDYGQLGDGTTTDSKVPVP